MSFMLLGILNAQASGGAAGAFDLLETTTLTSSASSVTFSAIDQTYKHLQIRSVVKANFGPVQTTLQMNGDTGANYATHYLNGNGSSVTSGAQTSASYVYGGYTAGTSETYGFGAGVCDILDYTSTSKNKTTRTLSGVVTNNTVVELRSGVWMNTSAVTSLTIALFGQLFTAGSRFSLYGVK